MLRGFGIAGLALAASIFAAAGQGMKSPRISSTQVDWDAAVLELAPIDALRPADAMAELNRATGERFANIAASPVPVLLPFDTAAFLRHRSAAAAAAGLATTVPTAPEDYLSGFSTVPFFYPGPAGYDAVVMARAQEMPELAIGYPEPIYIHIGGSALVYELDEPVGMIGWPVHGLEGIPGIRRLYLENFVRYTFVRYGVPYVVAIECSDAGLRIRRMSCRDADKVAVRFIKALHVAGGTPQNKPEAVHAAPIDRPLEQSEVFTYHSPGDIIPGTGFRRKGGVADYTVYSRMRFPIAEAPAFANSQSFMNWGNCEATGRTGAGKLDGVSTYRCRVSGQTLSRTNRPAQTTPIHGGIISASTATSMSVSAREGSAIRGRTFAPLRASNASRARTAANPTCTTWWRCATAQCCARPVRRRSTSWSMRPTSASGSAICTCCPGNSTPTGC